MNETREPNLKEMILLDTGSTDHLFCKPRLLKNVREVENGIGSSSNVGTITTNTKGFLPNLGDVWINKKALTNIVSFAKLATKHRITYDSSIPDEFVIHKPNELMKFKKKCKRLILP